MGAYNKKWQDTCTGYFTERDCIKMTDGEGAARCAWEPLGEYMDCEMLWPTTTTTTEEPGCCKGSSYKAQAKCLPLMDEMGCARKGCEWIVTDEPDDCIITTTTTTTTTTTANAQQSMLFGGEASSVAEAMQYQVSLSTVLAFVVAAFALNWAYQCFVAKRNDGFKNIDAVRATSTYQAV